MRAALHDDDRHKLWYAQSTVADWEFVPDRHVSMEIDEVVGMSFVSMCTCFGLAAGAGMGGCTPARANHAGASKSGRKHQGSLSASMGVRRREALDEWCRGVSKTRRLEC